MRYNISEVMNKKYPLRQSVRIILINDVDELLLMCINDPLTKPIGERYKGPFWTPIGGQIKANETILDAAIRELYEETGMSKKDVVFGPFIWFGEFNLEVHGIPTHIEEKFIVARAKKKKLTQINFEKHETSIVKHLAWFSLNQIINIEETVYPVLLLEYLPDIIAGNYPKKPFNINMTI